MGLRARLVGAALAGAAVLALVSGPASAATSFWTLYNPVPDNAGNNLCISSPVAGGWATVGECSGAAAQDWAFSNGRPGQFLVSRAHPGYVLALSSMSAGAHLTLAKYDPTDVRQTFVAGDPVRTSFNHLRPYYSPGLCLQASPWRTERAPVMLDRCDRNPTGPQAWMSRFHGNY
jgi:hypothetical protein